MICTAHQILLEWWNREEWDWWGMWHVWGRGEVRTGFWWGILRERGHLEDPGVDGVIIKSDLQTVAWGWVDWSDLAHALRDGFKLYITEWPSSQMRTASSLLLRHHCCSVLPALTQSEPVNIRAIIPLCSSNGLVVVSRINIYVKHNFLVYLLSAATCFDLRSSSGHALMQVRKCHVHIGIPCIYSTKTFVIITSIIQVKYRWVILL